MGYEIGRVVDIRLVDHRAHQVSVPVAFVLVVVAGEIRSETSARESGLQGIVDFLKGLNLVLA